jgi:glycosyltransferase involved in cell wall biosynthesis
MTALRILALSYRCFRHPQSGGSEVNLFEQARRWTRDGHHVTVFTADPGRAHAPQRDEVIDGIVVRRSGGRLTVYLHGMLFLLRHRHRFDCILDVANGIPFFSPLVTRTPGALLVNHFHDRQWFSEFPYLIAALGRFIERRVVPAVYRHWPVIAISPTTRDALVELGMNSSHIHIVYCGTIEPDPAQQIGDTRMPRIAYVGRLKQYKRLELLVRAVERLRHELPDIHLDIAGDGDAALKIEKLITTLHLQDNVTMHGFVDEQHKARILRSATVFATPSTHEGWGLSVIEANAHGCPAVAYDVPGLRVAIRHGETGLLAADDDSFVQALAFFLKDPEARKLYSRAALAWAARFTWESCAKGTLEVLLTHSTKVRESSERGDGVSRSPARA